MTQQSQQITILPAQAARLSQETAKTGAAISVSQSGSTLAVDTGRERFLIGAGGQNIPNDLNQESLC